MENPSPAVLLPSRLLITWFPESSVVVDVPIMKTPYCALLITLLLMTFDELAVRALPLVLIEDVPPPNTPIRVVVEALPVIIEFLTVLLAAPWEAVALAIQTTPDVVPVFVFAMVRFLDDVPLFDPSIVTKLQPFSLKILVLEEPLTDVV